MANEVYANNREIACKAADGKSICAFPDVCFTPPQTPATPPGVPVPYPNTGMASDCTQGSKTVLISGKEVMLKNDSYFSKSTGDEAGCAPKKGVITGTNRGKVYFVTWSMDVKFEGKNVVRHLDLTTHNHNPAQGNTVCWPYTDRIAMAQATGKCTDTINAVDSSCQKDTKGNVACPSQGSLTKEQYALTLENDPCQRAARCLLSPYSPSRCCDPQTPHHLIAKAGFFADKFGGKLIGGITEYSENSAPCICAEGGKSQATHGLLHDYQTRGMNANFPGKDRWKFSDAIANAVEAMNQVCPQCKEDGCIEAQLREGHTGTGFKGINDNSDLRPIRQQPSDISSFKTTFANLQKSLDAAGSTAGGAAV